MPNCERMVNTGDRMASDRWGGPQYRAADGKLRNVHLGNSYLPSRYRKRKIPPLVKISACEEEKPVTHVKLVCVDCGNNGHTERYCWTKEHKDGAILCNTCCQNAPCSRHVYTSLLAESDDDSDDSIET